MKWKAGPKRVATEAEFEKEEATKSHKHDMSQREKRAAKWFFLI